MENNIEVIENIMKPYLEKKEQIEKSKTQSNVEINALKLRLERLLDNKEREIEEYISEAVNSSSNSFGVSSVICVTFGTYSHKYFTLCFVLIITFWSLI